MSTIEFPLFSEPINMWAHDSAAPLPHNIILSPSERYKNVDFHGNLATQPAADYTRVTMRSEEKSHLPSADRARFDLSKPVPYRACDISQFDGSNTSPRSIPTGDKEESNFSRSELSCYSPILHLSPCNPFSSRCVCAWELWKFRGRHKGALALRILSRLADAGESNDGVTGKRVIKQLKMT